MSDRSISTIAVLTSSKAAASTRALKVESEESIGKVASSAGNELPQQLSPPQLSPQAIAQRIARIATSIGHDIRFIVDLKDNQTVIEVLDRETGEVIRQIPAEEFATYAIGDGEPGIRLLNAVE